MQRIEISVQNRVAWQTNSTDYICGNNDFVVDFTFDNEWSKLGTKTARFIHGGQHTDIVFTGTECKVPEILNVKNMKIGVFAGNLYTTTPAMVHCRKSILCGGGVPANPEPDVYAQMMEMIDSGMLKGEKGEKGEPGEKGNPGKTPVKGVDYWTAEDKEAIINETINSNEIQEVIESVGTAIDIAERAESIARGKATGYVFDTFEDMQMWLANEANTKMLNLGDNLYIRALDVPDYWWDGNATQQLETEKVDLTEYVKKTDYTTEQWAFTLADGTSVDKKVVVG